VKRAILPATEENARREILLITEENTTRVIRHHGKEDKINGVNLQTMEEDVVKFILSVAKENARKIIPLMAEESAMKAILHHHVNEECETKAIRQYHATEEHVTKVTRLTIQGEGVVKLIFFMAAELKNKKTILITRERHTKIETHDLIKMTTSRKIHLRVERKTHPLPIKTIGGTRHFITNLL